MSLDKSEVEKIAWLSRLSISDSDVDNMGRELTSILDLVEEMNSAKTEGIEPLAHPLELNARLRPDAVTEENNREEFQAIAPEVEEGHYLVPKVID